jgi:enamine deaminase RidA (YjgF/YER057c/UK114 family)
MGIAQLNPAGLPVPTGNYTHGTLVTEAQRTVFVSGQVNWSDENGEIPSDFETQYRTVWRNVLAVLAEADMGVRNLAKVNMYLADRRFRDVSSTLREEILGDHCPALTIIICDIYHEAWLLEIEAVAVDVG